MADFKNEALEVLKKHAKAALTELVSGPAVEGALMAAKDAIPGKIDDAVIDLLKEPLKAELLKLIQGL